MVFVDETWLGWLRDAAGKAVPELEEPIEDRARVIEVGLGRMVGRRGEALEDAVADMMLGSWSPPGLAEPYDPVDSGGEEERLVAPPYS